MVPPGAGATEFGAALLMFYSFTGFESIAVASRRYGESTKIYQ